MPAQRFAPAPKLNSFIQTYFIKIFNEILLLKVLHTTLKDLQILLAIDINCYSSISSLRVSHLTEASSVR